MHDPNRPKIPEVLPLLKEYRKKYPWCGGPLHIVLDDGNFETDHVQYCLDEAKRTEDAEGISLAEKMLLMTKTQRSKLYYLARELEAKY